MNKKILPGILSAATLAYAGLAPAYEAGDWMVRAGSHYVDPKSDNNDIVKVDGAFGATGSIEYFATPTIAVDLLLAVPFKHDIKLDQGGGKVASTRHLPPTLSVLWYPALDPTWHPFIGAGINYTIFFDENTSGVLNGTKLTLDNSVGAAFVGGLAVDVAPQWSVVFDVRYIDIDTKAKVDGNSIGTVEVDPMTYGLSVGYKF